MTAFFDDRPDMSPYTTRTYRYQWNKFAEWAAEHGYEPLPAEPDQIAAYLTERHELDGCRPATLNLAKAAIAYVHAAHDMTDPCSHPVVKRTLKGIRRTAGTAQRQAKGLTAEGVEAIIATACEPRRYESNGNSRGESVECARRRGLVDIALVLVMRDGLLRAGEAAALRWDDIEAMPDGSGRLLVRRSKTDQTGDGTVLYLSPRTMAALHSMRRHDIDPPEARIFQWDASNVSLHITKAAQHAGLGDGYSGHSPRVGMAQDLARAGVELPSLMVAGRWKSPMMPARYIRNETAERGAVAQYHRKLS